MGGTPIAPHISWSGPQPATEVEAYVLAMMLRIWSFGVYKEEERDITVAPTVLTMSALKAVSGMYAYYKEKIADESIRTPDQLLKMINRDGDVDVTDWMLKNRPKIVKAEQELIDYVDTPSNPGFRCFG